MAEAAMLARDLFDFRAVLLQKGIIFAYSGYVTEPVLNGVGEALKQKLAIQDADTKTVRSVFAIFVEQMQNMIRYSAEKVPPQARPDTPLELRYGVLTIGQENGDYVVHAGNLIHHVDVERLRRRLSALSTMDREQLKAAYKEQLKAEPDEQSKGAGIGFIEIARRASKPIEFDFMDVDDDYAFFALKACV
jgi:Family of unknown function (DUF6272)